jgi:uncharacterized protein involved in outer membrane biogenesis
VPRGDVVLLHQPAHRIVISDHRFAQCGTRTNRCSRTQAGHVACTPTCMRRPLPIVLFALAATLVGMAVFVVLFDWSIARGPIERAFEVRTGRTLSIRGPLELSFWPPRLIAHDVTISNPSWARRPNLLEARQISIIPSLRALLAGRVRFANWASSSPSCHSRCGTTNAAGPRAPPQRGAY